MASNIHYEVDLLSLEVTETKAPKLGEILRIADQPNALNPFGNRLQKGKFVISRERKWLFDEQLADFNYQSSGYNAEVSEFRVSLAFDTPLDLADINSDRFLYSLSKQLSGGNWRDRRRGVGTYFRLGELSEGSIRGEIFAGIVALGGFVATYPDLKQGFRELLTDGQYVSQHISTVLRASKRPDLPERDDQEDVNRLPEGVITEQRRTRRNRQQIRE